MLPSPEGPSQLRDNLWPTPNTPSGLWQRLAGKRHTGKGRGSEFAAAQLAPTMPGVVHLCASM